MDFYRVYIEVYGFMNEKELLDNLLQEREDGDVIDENLITSPSSRS